MKSSKNVNVKETEWMKWRFVVVTALVLLLASCSQIDRSYSHSDVEKMREERLRVLYVGQNPATVEGYDYGGDRDFIDELKKSRAEEFMVFLSKYFDATLVYGEEYIPEFSKDYDVTIFDALPMELEGKDLESGSRRSWRERRGWRYLPDDFDRAAIFVAGVAGPMASDPLSLKLKWLCNCLSGYAIDVEQSHPIFNTPYKVDIDYQGYPTPKSFLSYYSGRNLGRTLPMWKVQRDAPEGRQYPPGLVTYPGLDDSPDGEVISGGTSIKMKEAVAIGRQGNFLQWGFRASPDYMVENLRLAFVNAVYYISKFNGKNAIVRSISNRRINALDSPYGISDQGWTLYEEKYAQRLRSYESSLSRVEAGVAREGDKRRASKPPKPLMREKLLQYQPKELQVRFGRDWNRYLEFFLENYDYLIPSGPNEYVVDNDVKKIGIANSDIRLLEKCIEMLEANQGGGLPSRILVRYTQNDFDSVEKWRAWFDESKDRIFFTERGGFKFMVSPR